MRHESLRLGQRSRDDDRRPARVEVGASRLVHLSAGDGPMRPYLEAKHEADERLMASALDWTVVRPGGLTDDPGTEKVDLSTEMGRRKNIPREDVAAILAACLVTPETIGLAFEAFEGDQDIELALRALARSEA